MWAAKFKPFLIHLGISTLVALAGVALVFGVWYPSPLAAALGVTEIFAIVVMVDVVMGPALTFVIYQPSKPSLKFDLSVIALLQLSALVYGLYTVSVARPAWVVFNVDRFDVVAANELDGRELDLVPVQYRSAPWFGPHIVAAKMPDDIELRNTINLEAGFGSVDLPQRPRFYEPVANLVEPIQARQKDLSALAKLNDQAQISAALRHCSTADGWLPIMARVEPKVMLLNKGQVCAIVDLRPWD